MSFSRYSRSLKTSYSGLSRIASLLASDTARSPRTPSAPLCFRCYARQYQHRRALSTATEYKPYTLDPAPPPPRNTGIPDTSIAGPEPQVNDTRPSRLTGQYHRSSASSQQGERATFSLNEAEAQKSKPVTDPSSSSPNQSKRPKLRARKAAMSLTPTATQQLRNLLDQPEPKLIRVGVKNRGCSGLAYHLEYVDKQGAFDEAVEQDGVKVLVDSKALFSIIGSEMDWVEDKLEQRFVFRNPNIKEQCGCGESFMV